MTISKRFASMCLAAALALPLAARAEDAPGVFKVPGTDSTIKFYGYTQLDMTLDFGARVGDIENNDWATILPAVPANGSAEEKHKKPQFYMTARTSRFGIQTSTPTSLGAVGVRLEGDFNGPNDFQSETYTNSVLFRLRHAYGTVGGLLVGQTWTTMIDLAAAPDTVDFNGPGTLALVRNPMIRYTFDLGNGMSFALAAENARGAQFGGAKFQTVPDFHANFGMSGSWGTLSLRGVSQYYRLFAGDADPISKWSFSGAASGSLKFAGDTLVWQFAGGPGIGRYMLNALGVAQNLPSTGPTADPAAVGGNAGGFLIGPSGAIELVTVLGAHVGYTHVWSPAFRSNLVAAGTWVVDPKIAGRPVGADVEKEMYQGFVNTFWTFAKNAEFGLEFTYGQWKSFATAGVGELKGEQYRVNSTFHYNFF